jgi:tyrosine aminotransferase
MLHTDINEVHKQRSWKGVRAADAAMRTSNPIRTIVDQMDPSQANKDKPLIALSIGDPTVFGNLHTHQVVVNSMVQAAQSGNYNGYAHSCGYKFAREAVAKRYSLSNHKLTDDVSVFIHSFIEN